MSRLMNDGDDATVLFMVAVVAMVFAVVLGIPILFLMNPGFFEQFAPAVLP